MKKVFLVLFFTTAGGFLYAQNVATINSNPISSKEFLWVYKKNHAGQANLNQKELAAYLDLYVNFKLKVAEAKSLGLDADETYKEEIAGYEDALKAQKKVSADTPEYAYIMNEYREGVLMFNVCEQKIWGKAQEDDEKLKTYYTNNAKNYEGKPFEEVRGQVVGDYQQQLETEWVNSLRSKYKIKINQAELKKLTKQ
ncbi:hypothetical protein [Pedobacter xixiisoli]|uniref:Peptidylprolyl isomerase n=1 Tax=Pedobacter xixiisoli TaxID=1476464 RepID=A0A286A017_9SPHI|nr:hypothetical protein [Pedobacter xixiisoli]SOD15244.1 hypothetical protein SAMN06297358_2225 [Pedobacter xixiisoli]